MTRIEEAVAYAIGINARHRKGHRIGDLGPCAVAAWLAQEVDELWKAVRDDEPDALDEAGDVLVLLVHLARLSGWTMRDVEAAAARKLWLRHGIDEAARVVPLDRLAISPQCGFASAASGNPVTPADQEAKLRLVIDVAGEVWGERST